MVYLLSVEHQSGVIPNLSPQGESFLFIHLKKTILGLYSAIVFIGGVKTEVSKQSLFYVFDQLLCTTRYI